MNKDEILQKVKNRKPNQFDEMELDILQKGSRFGMICGMIGCLILMFIKIKADLPFSDVYSIYSLMMAGLYLYKWNRIKYNKDLWIGILWGLVAIGLCYGYITEVF